MQKYLGRLFASNQTIARDRSFFADFLLCTVCSDEKCLIQEELPLSNSLTRGEHDGENFNSLCHCARKLQSF